MAIDYGDVRTGIAVCDKFEMLASPVCVITQRNSDILIEEIKKLADEHNVEQFVVGLPKNMDSSVGVSLPSNITLFIFFHQLLIF